MTTLFEVCSLFILFEVCWLFILFEVCWLFIGTDPFSFYFFHMACDRFLLISWSPAISTLFPTGTTASFFDILPSCYHTVATTTLQKWQVALMANCWTCNYKRKWWVSVWGKIIDDQLFTFPWKWRSTLIILTLRPRNTYIYVFQALFGFCNF